MTQELIMNSKTKVLSDLAIYSCPGSLNTATR
jgi:hypothetical protein